MPDNHNRKNKLEEWKKIFLVALAYFLIGKAIQFLPLNPNEASILRPLAGIGLGVLLYGGLRMAIGIWIGLTALHLGPITHPSGILELVGSIAGELAQCFAGVWMVRRICRTPFLHQEETDLWKFIFLAPLLGMITPSFHAGVRFLLGRGNPMENAVSWSYAWIGESLGIMLFTPILSLWLTRDPLKGRGKTAAVTLPTAGSFVIALGLCLMVTHSENHRIRETFEQNTTRIIGNIEKRMKDFVDHLDFVERFFASSDFVARQEFHLFLAPFLASHPDVVLMWAPRVRGKGQRSDSYSTLYEEPPPGQVGWTSYDWAANPVSGAIIGEMEREGKSKGTFLSFFGKEYFFVFAPVYGNKDIPLKDPNKITGILVMTLPFNNLLSDENSRAKMDGIRVRWGSSIAIATTSEPSPIDKSFEFLGSHWTFHSELDPDFARRQRNWTTAGLFAGGLFFSALLESLLLVVTGRSSRISALVEERTSELQRANEELNRHLVEKDAIERMKRDFISSVSHELRTPLTSIKGYMSIVLRDQSMPEATRREFLGIVDEEADRLSYLVEDLLEISRLESGAVALTVEKLDLITLSETILRSIRPMADKKKLRLEMEAPAYLGPVDGHAGKIRSLLTNLLSNAVKFTLEEGGRVGLALSGDDEQVYIRVSDSGIGIPKDDLPKIFDRFFRVERQGVQIQGTGLGLAIVKHIVSIHRGEIRVESELGKGTTFTVRLPRIYTNTPSKGGSTVDAANI